MPTATGALPLKQILERWIPRIVIAPSFAASLFFVYGFIGWTATVSLSKWDSVEPDYTWVGFENFRRLLIGEGTSARRFHIDLWNTFFFTLLFWGFTFSWDFFPFLNLNDLFLHFLNLFDNSRRNNM